MDLDGLVRMLGWNQCGVGDLASFCRPCEVKGATPFHATIHPRMPGQPLSSRAKRPKFGDLPESLVANKLLELVGRGSCSVSTVASLARTCQADGLEKHALSAIASIGTNGAHDNNAERDLLRMAQGLWGFHLEPYEITLELCVPQHPLVLESIHVSLHELNSTASQGRKERRADPSDHKRALTP